MESFKLYRGHLDNKAFSEIIKKIIKPCSFLCRNDFISSVRLNLKNLLEKSVCPLMIFRFFGHMDVATLVYTHIKHGRCIHTRVAPGDDDDTFGLLPYHKRLPCFIWHISVPDALPDVTPPTICASTQS